MQYPSNWFYPTFVVGALSLFGLHNVAEATVRGLAESISRQLGRSTA